MGGSRRDFVKLSTLAGLSLAVGPASSGIDRALTAPERSAGSTVDLLLAGYPFEHVRPLIDGDVEALFHAAEPQAFLDGNPKVRRLFDDPRTVERDYFARTGIFPIMHAVAIRNDRVEAHPWLPMALFKAYSEAKARRYASMRMGWVMETLPWFGQEFDEARALMGENFWPYGLAANETALSGLLRYAHEQGLAKRQLDLEELFHSSTHAALEA